MTNLRTQAAAAAMKWYETHPEGMPRDMDTATAMYLLGHAAGVLDGARRFAEYSWDCLTENEYLNSWSMVEKVLARFLSSLAPGTGLATGEGQKEEG